MAHSKKPYASADKFVSPRMRVKSRKSGVLLNMRSSILPRFVMLGALLCAASLPGGLALAQQSTPNKENVDVNKIIRAFTTKETEFRQALNNYAFKRDAIIQTLGMGGQVTGE